MTIDMIRPEKLDRSVNLDGLDYIDVPALGRRDYQLRFHSFKECSILAKVRGQLIIPLHPDWHGILLIASKKIIVCLDMRVD